MQSTYRSAETLLACRLATRDGFEAGLTDLMLDARDWHVRFLAVDAQTWALDRDALLTPRVLGTIDEARRLIGIDLTAEELKASPLLDAGSGRAGFDAAGLPTPPHWREHWRARIAPEGGVDPPPPPVHAAETAPDLGAETSLSADQMIRADNLRGLRAETADGSELRILDLLIDDTDWSVAYFDLLRAADRGARGREAGPLRCLLPPSGVDWLNPKTETLYLTVFIQELRDAPTRHLPVAGGAGTAVRVLDLPG
jgi:hypothetical protein